MVSLNTKRVYNEIYGQLHGAVYSQRGLYFDHAGELIPDHPMYGPAELERVAALTAKEDRTAKKGAVVVDDEDDEEFFAGKADDDDDDEDNPSPPPKPKPIPKPTKPQPPAPLPRTARLQAKPPPTKPEPPPVSIERTVGPAVDLKMWALGKKSYQFMTVRNEIKRKYSFMAMNKVSAINFLVDEGVVKEKDLAK
jgi:hypothetical protein